MLAPQQEMSAVLLVGGIAVGLIIGDATLPQMVPFLGAPLGHLVFGGVGIVSTVLAYELIAGVHRARTKTRH